MFLKRSAALLAASLLCAVVSPRMAQAALSFQPPVHVGVRGASEVRAADMDGDGALDLVAVGTEGVTILYGEGDGTFGARVSYPLGGGLGLHNHIQIALPDLNGDGARDLVIPVLNLDKLLVFINRGQRTFAPAVNYPVGGNPESLVAGDFNRDGWQDVAVSNLGGGSMSVLLNRGDGALLPPVTYPGIGHAGGLTGADFNGDGSLDLAMSTFYGNQGVLYLGDGTGRFAGSRYEVGGATPGRVTTEDFNGDGQIDLAVANYHSNNVSILFGNGRGAFSRPVNYEANQYPFVIAAPDLDSDGDPDLVMVNSTLDYFTVLENGEDGNFLPAVKIPSGGRFVQGLTAADFNGDGRPDVAIAHAESDAVSVFLNDTPRPSPAILAFDLDPSTLIGGCQSATGTLTLTAPAPAGGTVISLSSSNPAVAMPPHITVPEGAVTARFMPVLSAVSTVQTGALSARIPGSGKRARITVLPSGNPGLQIVPSELIGGRPAGGQVTLACPAGPDGVVVTLASRHPQVVQLPATAAIPAGATTAVFELTTRPVSVTTPVVITATFAGLTRTVTLLVRPVPPPPPTTPAPPNGLVALAVSTDQIILSWIDNSREEIGFAVHRREGNGPWVQIALLGPNVTRFADLDVRHGSTYTYRVQAVGSTGVSGWSNELTVITAPVETLRLLVSSHDSNSVVRFDGHTGAPTEPFVTPGSGGLSGTHGLTLGPDGNLYVSNRYGHSILRYDGRTGAFLDAFVPAGRSSGGLDIPIGLTFGPDGHLYVSSYGTDSILRYDGRTGIFIGPFVPRGSGGLHQPYGVIFGPDGNLYVCSHGSHSILRYDGRTGAFLGAFVPERRGGLDTPKGLTFGPDGHLYVTSSGTHSILRYDGRTGTFLGTFVPSQSGGLTVAAGLVFGPDGHLYATSAATNSVLRYDGRTGAFLGIFATGGGLRSPSWLIFAPQVPSSPPAFPAPPVPPAPAAPTHLVVERIEATRVELRWQDNSDNEQHFILWRRTGSSGELVRIGHVGANVTRFTDSGLQPRTTYTYIVRAWNAQGGPSRRSNELTITTPALPPVSLNPPSAVSATAVSATQIRLTWIDDVAGEAVFVVYRKGPGEAEFVMYADVPANGTGYLDRLLTPGATYTYHVRAWHPVRGVSHRSNEVSVTLPLAR